MKSFLTLLALTTFFLLPAAPAAAQASAKPSCCASLEPAVKLSDSSVLQPDSSWTNDSARAVKLASFAGKPTIATMFFSSCAFACPILVNDMKKIEAALPENIRTNVSFLMISFDSDRDTPSALAAFRARHQLAENWSLLRGSPDDVLEIAALVGIKFKKDSRGDFAHSNVISVLDKKGEIVLQQIGLNRDPDPISSKVEDLFEAANPHPLSLTP